MRVSNLLLSQSLLPPLDRTATLMSITFHSGLHLKVESDQRLRSIDFLPVPHNTVVSPTTHFLSLFLRRQSFVKTMTLAVNSILEPSNSCDVRSSLMEDKSVSQWWYTDKPNQTYNQERGLLEYAAIWISSESTASPALGSWSVCGTMVPHMSLITSHFPPKTHVSSATQLSPGSGVSPPCTAKRGRLLEYCLSSPQIAALSDAAIDLQGTGLFVLNECRFR